MLKIPTLRQVSSVTCLPTCLRAVLAYRGLELSEEEVVEACDTSVDGTRADMAVQGLSDAGFDVEIRQFADAEALRECLGEGQPVIAFLQHPSGQLHAVVVCEVDAEEVTYMDPARGEYRSMSIALFERHWLNMQNEAMVVGRRRTDAS